MNRVVFFVEDEAALTPYIVDARDTHMFPGWKILAGDTIDDAIAWCEANNGDSKAVFVVDSRMTSEQLRPRLVKALSGTGVDLDDLAQPMDNEVLTGALGTIVLKWLKPDCRTILVSAFFRTIEDIRRKQPVLNGLLQQSIDRALPKREPSLLTEAIRGQTAIFETQPHRIV